MPGALHFYSPNGVYESTPNPVQMAMDAADTLFYTAKNRAYRENGYYSEMQDIDTKIDFARSLAVASIVLMVFTLFAAILFLFRATLRAAGLFLTTAWQSTTTASFEDPMLDQFTNDYAAFLGFLSPIGIVVPTQRVIVRTSVCLCFLGLAAYLGRVAYLAESKEFNQRAFGYFASLKEIDSKVARPRNIGELKEALRDYHKNQYSKDMQAAAQRATDLLPPKCDANGAIVLDVDETALSNWEEIDADDFGYNRKRFDSYVEQWRSPRIEPTFQFYSEALKRGCKVFFITSRPECERTVTENNLREQLYSTWQKLIMKPDNATSVSASFFKANERRKLVQEGSEIILNVGDQESDLAGGWAEHRILLPNPFYVVR